MDLSKSTQSAAYQVWQAKRNGPLWAQLTATDLSGSFAAMPKSAWMFLQSAILGLGAYLVLQDAVSLGVMIVRSILMGCALAPIETRINQ